MWLTGPRGATPLDRREPKSQPAKEGQFLTGVDTLSLDRAGAEGPIPHE
jgi:hypothetical protein